MSFLNPVAFWLFSLLIIPIIIHLFNFRKAKVVYFSNVGFLANTKSTSSSKNTLKRYLILLLRLLAFTALVIAIAQPFFVDPSTRMQDSRRVVYLDNSMSMGRLTVGGADGLSSGIEIVQMINSTNEEGMMLMTNDLHGSKRWLRQSEVSEALSEVSLQPTVSDVRSVIDRSKRAAGDGKNILIVSDFQKSSFVGLKEFLGDTTTRFELVKVRPEQQGNLFPDTVFLENPVGFSANGKLKFSVNNTGEAKSGVLIRVFRGDVQFASFTRDFQENSKSWIEVQLSEKNNYNTGEYRIVLEDAVFPFDNEYLLKVQSFEAKQVVILYDDVKNRSLEAVFSNADYFSSQQQQIGTVDIQSLSTADVIVLDGLKVLPAWLTEKINFYEGLVLAVPDRTVDPGSYAAVIGKNLSLSRDTSRYAIARGSLDHPLFESVFDKKEEQSSLPEMRQLLDFGSVADIILKSELNAPFLARVRENFYIFSSPLTDEYTNLHRHALFLPIMYQMILKRDGAGALAYRLNDAILPVQVSLPSEPQELSFVSEDERIVPVLRNIDGRRFIELPIKPSRPDFYYLIADGDTLDTYALNLPKEESLLESISNEEMRAWTSEYHNVKFIDADDQREMARSLGDGNQEIPLWKYALILALIFLIAEQTLLRILK